MKPSTKHLLLWALVACATLTVQAKTITINPKTVRGDLTQRLREVCDKANHRDTIVLDFDKGDYQIDGSILFRSHLVIKGKGDKTTLYFNKGTDKAGFKAFNDDCFIDVWGSPDRPLSLSISDISMRLKDHLGIWWEKNSNYIFKIRHCNSVNISRVKSYTYNASITNFNLHVCSNVYITDCEITNYNNSENGGCLWLRGEMHNIHVKRNKFTKYGKDEVIAVFDRLVDNTKQYIRGKANRTDIFIEDNEFYYGSNDRDKNPESLCDMVFSLFTDHKKSDDRCLTRNFHLRGNKFHINDICTRCMYIGFDPADEHSDIYIENNEIIHNRLDSNEPFYYCDIEVHDLSSSTDVIHINGNTLNNNHPIVNKFGTTGYAFLVMRGGHVSMADNTIVNTAAKYPKTGKPYGIELVWCKSDGNNSDVTMTGNVCKGLDCIAHLGAWELAEKITLNASNNYFAGNTRVFCDQIQRLDVDFTGNTFNCQNKTIFLDGFAQKGNVVFNNNEVTVGSGGGQFMTRGSGNSGGRIERLEVQNNVFKGVKNENDLFKNVTNVKKRKVKSNRISRY